MLENKPVDYPTNVAQILAEEILLVIERAQRLVGVEPALVIAAINACCVHVHCRFGSGASLPAVLRNEADRLERMDKLDRAAGVN